MQQPQDPQNQPELIAAMNETGIPEGGENKSAEPVMDTMPSLEQLLKKAELDAAEHHGGADDSGGGLGDR